MYRYQISTIT